ncbi:MAG: multicopper oxidase domain-containing protein [Campylobacteraceae bacterium]|nr:multicopper oxidase domain-containing protein [Campylobacteraceae bacterium]
MKRRNFVKLSISSLVVSSLRPLNLQAKVIQNELKIPILIDSKINKDIKISIQNSLHEFVKGVKSNTLSFSDTYLGPTIKLYQNHKTNITFFNKINEETTVHGHGLLVNGDVDGGPQSIILPGKSKKIDLDITQEAGLSWYHPHIMEKTAEQVHSGLAGLYIIEDENSLNLNIPKTYGLDDIPLIIQDRSFTNGKMTKYKASGEVMMEGLREDTIVVNGVLNAKKTVPKGWIRLRLLNASNARFYKFTFKNNLKFFKIATESSFLNKAIEISELIMSPGERNEIMIDLSNQKSVKLLANFLPADEEDEMFFMKWFTKTQTVLELNVDKNNTTSTILPDKLNNIKYLKKNDAKRTRKFELEMDDENNSSNMFKINGKTMDMNYINEHIKKGEIEIWKIKGDMMPHPFHIHGVAFQILKHNGKRPKLEDQGWKDTIIISNEWTKVIMKFDKEADKKTPFMYHCHILEHEDKGMMGQFVVK